MSRVARSNIALGGDTLPISNETLSWTENCLPSSKGDNDVSLAAHGNTAISQIKKRVAPRCRWTEGGCSNTVQSNPKRFCSKYYSAWLLIQVGGGGAPAINNNTIGCGEQAGGGGLPAINNDTINRGEQAVDRSNNDTIGNGEQAGGGGTPSINNDAISRGGEAGGYYQQLIKLQIEEIKESKRMLYEQQQLQSRDEKIRILESNVHIMRKDMNTIVEHMRDQRTSGVHTEVFNSTTNN